MSEVCREGANTLNARTVPMIFIPGVMGTRLYFPNADEYWDPDSKWRMLHWLRISADRARREMHFSQPAQVMTENDDLTALERTRGWAGAVTEFYVPFLRHLVATCFTCASTTVWAIGYDWRQSNRDSGALIDAEIDRILGDQEVEEYVLITHSMGGLASRSCLQEDTSGNAGKLLGVVHVFQPAQGAVVFYRRMYTGAVDPLDPAHPLNTIMGNTPAKFATLLSGMRGPCELIPNNDYRHSGGDWLWGAPRVSSGMVVSTPTPFTGNMYTHYQAATGPPGVAWSVTSTIATQLRTRMAQGEAFHSRLGSYKHPRTWAIYSTELVTDVEVHFTGTTPGTVQAVQLAEGDGTVPAASGGALFSAAETSTDATGRIFMIDRSKRQFAASGVEHASAFNDGTVRTVVEKMLLVVLGCAWPAGDYPTDSGDDRAV